MDVIKSCYPEEIVQYYSPAYPAQLLEKRFKFQKKRKHDSTEFDGENAVQEYVEKICNPLKPEGERTWIAAKGKGGRARIPEDTSEEESD